MTEQKYVTFGAVGDINLARPGDECMRRHGAAWPFQNMFGALREADLLFGNMESVILPTDYPQEEIDPKGLLSRYDSSVALKEAGFDILNLAQNHILDAGACGMFHTQQVIEATGVMTAGIGRTQAEARQMRVLEKGGLRFGFLCYCEDSNYTLGTTGPCHAYYTRENVLTDIERWRRDVDVLVVSIHADLEFMPTPSVPRRQIMREAARAGATLVLGHHPHVPQGMERVGDALVVYSLGNFIFNSHSWDYMRNHLPHTARSFLLLAEVERGKVGAVRRVPFAIQPDPDERPALMVGAQKQQMLAYLDELDRMAADDEVVQRNWRQIALRHLTWKLNEARQLNRDDLLVETLGRLLLVQENRNWMEEVLAAVKENWDRQASVIDPLHRPHYAMERREKQDSTSMQ